MTGPACPLCDRVRTKTSWYGATGFHGKRFRYQECQTCGSHFVVPMPDATDLAAMYSADYEGVNVAQDGESGPKRPDKVLGRLATRMPGTFVDFGCGAGELLTSASDLGWDVVGVEFVPEVARRTQRETGLRVVTVPDAASTIIGADVLHLGDVIEHMTSPFEQLSAALGLLRPGGTLLAQGPLEVNSHLFAWGLRVARLRERGKDASIPPYHVVLATARGQRALFRRAGLRDLDFELSEVAWPGPAGLDRGSLGQPRTLALRALRIASQALSAAAPQGRLGNRYFYTGLRP